MIHSHKIIAVIPIIERILCFGLYTLISGGESDSGALNQILVFNSAQNTWMGGGQPMKYQRYKHAVALLPNVSRFCPWRFWRKLWKLHSCHLFDQNLVFILTDNKKSYQSWEQTGPFLVNVCRVCGLPLVGGFDWTSLTCKRWNCSWFSLQITTLLFTNHRLQQLLWHWTNVRSEKWHLKILQNKRSR